MATASSKAAPAPGRILTTRSLAWARVAALAATVALAACGGGGGGEGSGGNAQPPVAGPPPPPPPPPVDPTPPPPSRGDEYGSGPSTSPDPSGEPTSGDLIDAALARGEITVLQSLVHKLQADYGDVSLPAHYKGDDVGQIEGHAHAEAMAYIVEAGGIGSLSEAAKDALLPYFVPSYYEGSWWHRQRSSASALAAKGRKQALAASAQAGVVKPAAAGPNCRAWQEGCAVLAEWRQVPGTRFVVWYLAEHEATDAPKATLLLGELEGSVWPKLTALMGVTPISDAGAGFIQAETDGRYDVILGELPDGKEGVTAPVAGGCKSVPTHITLSRTLPMQGLQAQAAHEFMHALQYAKPLAAACVAKYYTTQEATAVWATNFVYPHNDWEHRYAKFYLAGGWVSQAYDEAPQSKANDGFRYGAYLLPLFLSGKFDDNIVRDIWDAAATHGRELFAIEKAVQGRGKQFSEVWPEFVAANWNRERLLTYVQRDAMAEPAELTTAEATLTVSGGNNRYIAHGVSLPHAAAAYHHVKINDPSVRSLTIINGLSYKTESRDLIAEQAGRGPGKAVVHTPLEYTQRHGASMQLYMKVGGQWRSGVTDISNVPQITICRDHPQGKVEEIVFMYANAELTPNAPNYQSLEPRGISPGVLASNIGCRDMEGTYSMTRSFDGGMTETVTVTGLKLDNIAGVDQMTPPPPGSVMETYIGDQWAGQPLSFGLGWHYRIAAGNGTWTIGGSGNGCTYNGHASFSVAGQAGLRTSAWAPPDTAYPRHVEMPSLLFPNAHQTLSNLRYDATCTVAGETTTTSHPGAFTLDALSMSALRATAVDVAADGLTFSGGGRQTLLGPEGVSGGWTLKIKTTD